MYLEFQSAIIFSLILQEGSSVQDLSVTPWFRVALQFLLLCVCIRVVFSQLKSMGGLFIDHLGTQQGLLSLLMCSMLISVIECSSNECATATREMEVVLEGHVYLSIKNLPSCYGSPYISQEHVPCVRQHAGYFLVARSKTLEMNKGKMTQLFMFAIQMLHAYCFWFTLKQNLKRGFVLGMPF